MAPKEAELRETAPRRILVVDDNVDAAASLALLLDLSGNITHLAHDGESALEAAEKLVVSLERFHDLTLLL